jgi:hypothetical protein
LLGELLEGKPHEQFLWGGAGNGRGSSAPRQSLTRQLVFKQLKTLAELGALPKHTDESARAWLYGKLLVVLLGQKLERLGRDISPWGYRLPDAWQWQRVAGF